MDVSSSTSTVVGSPPLASSGLMIGRSRQYSTQENIAWMEACDRLTKELEAFQALLGATPSSIIEGGLVGEGGMEWQEPSCSPLGGVGPPLVDDDDDDDVSGGDSGVGVEPDDAFSSAWEAEISKYMRLTDSSSTRAGAAGTGGGTGDAGRRVAPDGDALRQKLHQIWDEDLWRDEGGKTARSPPSSSGGGVGSSRVGGSSHLRPPAFRKQSNKRKEKKEMLQQLERYKRQLAGVEKRCKAAMRSGWQKQQQFLAQVQDDLHKYETWGNVELKMKALSLVKLRMCRYQILQRIEQLKADVMVQRLEDVANVIALVKAGEPVGELTRSLFIDPSILVEQDASIGKHRKINLRLDAIKGNVAQSFLRCKALATNETEETRAAKMRNVLQHAKILHAELQYHEPFSPEQELFNALIYDQRFRSGARLRQIVQVLDAQQESGDIQWVPEDIVQECVQTTDTLIEEFGLAEPIALVADGTGAGAPAASAAGGAATTGGGGSASVATQDSPGGAGGGGGGEPPATAPPPTREMIECFVERAVFGLVHQLCYERTSAGQREKNARYHRQLRWLSSVSIHQLGRSIGIPPCYCRLQEAETSPRALYRGCIDRMNDVMFYSTPRDIMYCFKDATSMLYEEGVARGGKSLGADELVPLFTYCLVQARIPNLWDILEYTSSYGSDHMIHMGELAWCLTTLNASATYITDTLSEDEVLRVDER